MVGGGRGRLDWTLWSLSLAAEDFSRGVRPVTEGAASLLCCSREQNQEQWEHLR